MVSSMKLAFDKAQQAPINLARERAEKLFQKPEQTEQVPPPKPTLPDLKQQETTVSKEPLTGECTVAVRISNKDSRTLLIGIPSNLLGALGDPKRVTITGSVHEGLIVKETKDPEAGLKCRYVGGTKVYFSRSIADQKLSRDLRKSVPCKAVVERDVIKIDRCPADWVLNAAMWKTEPKKNRVPKHEVKLKKSEGWTENGQVLKVSPPAQATVTPIAKPSDPDLIKQCITAAVEDLLKLKLELERATGLKFRFERNLVLALSI